MDIVFIWLIAIPLIILEIIMIVKFFQIANDIRALKHYFIDGYKTLKTKDKYGNSINFKCYKDELLKTISYETWENARENIIQPMLDDYYKEWPQYKQWSQAQAAQENGENDETQSTEK